MRTRLRIIAKLLSPVPFLIGMVMLLAAFWQSDADFVFGSVTSVEAVLVDAGPAHPARGRPHYFPTFRLPNGQRLTLERATLAADLPPADQPVPLQCSTGKPANCKVPGKAGSDVVFYGIAALWSACVVGLAVAMWGPVCRRVMGRLRAKHFAI
jgi:hypothetical protein